MRNLDLTKIKNKDYTSFRKIAIGTWKNAYDPSVYGTMEVNADKVVDYMARYREVTGLHVTISHIMAKAVAAALDEMPEANAILRFNRIYQRNNIGVFFQVAMKGEDDNEDKIDLSGATIYDVEQKSLAEVITEFQAKVDKVRDHKDEALEKTRKNFRWIPFWGLNRFLRVISFMQSTLNIKLPGLPQDPFGSIMITNIGSLGLETAYVPLVPYSRVPMLLALGKLRRLPRLIDEELAFPWILKVNATFDHRFIDGKHAAVMSKVIRRWFAEPDNYLGDPAGQAPAREKAKVEALPAPE